MTLSKDDITNYAAITAAVIAAINVFVTIVNIFVSSRSQKRSVFANVVSANRIRWIEDLRKDVSQYIGLATAIRRLHVSKFNIEANYRPGVFTKAEDDAKNAFLVESVEKEIRDKAEQSVILQCLLHIKLNITQKEQLDVWRKLELLPIDGDAKDFAEATENLTTSTRVLLNKEWKRVEKLK